MKGMIVGALASAAVIMGAATTPSQAQGISDGTVRLVVPFSAGGSVDQAGRQIAAGLSKLWGADVVVENKTGASGIIGSQDVASSAPDGRTLLMVTTSHALNSLIYPSVPYDAAADFTPIAKVTEQGSVMYAQPDGPYGSAEDVLEKLKTGEGGAFQFGTPGAGTNAHMAGELLGYLTKGQVEPVHFEGGAGVATAVLGGHIPAGISGISGATPHFQAGTLVPLAVTGPERDMSLPDTPTFAELGVDGYSASVWSGILGPAGMDPAMVTFINDSLRQVLSDPAVLEEFAKGGVVPEVSTPEEFAALIANTTTLWEPVIEAAGLKQQ